MPMEALTCKFLRTGLWSLRMLVDACIPGGPCASLFRCVRHLALHAGVQHAATRFDLRCGHTACAQKKALHAKLLLAQFLLLSQCQQMLNNPMQTNAFKAGQTQGKCAAPIQTPAWLPLPPCRCVRPQRHYVTRQDRPLIESSLSATRQPLPP